jgi:serine/threonine protein kinase
MGKDLTTGQQVAVKVMDLRRYDREFESEIRVLALLDGVAGTVRLRSSNVIRDTGYIYMDYVPHPNLFNYVRRHRRLSQDRALVIFWNLLSTLEDMHAQGIAHRDLKPDNVMVDPDTFNTTVLDFGLSMVIPASGLSDNFCGSKSSMYHCLTLTRSYVYVS